MTRDEAKQRIVEHLGGTTMLIDYLNTNSVSTTDKHPQQIGQVLADYRPHGGFTVVGYEAGKYWDDDGYPMPAAPNAWAPIPVGALT